MRKKRKGALHEAQSPNPNDELLNPKEHRNPKDETADRTPARRSTFELRISFVICNPSFENSFVVPMHVRSERGLFEPREASGVRPIYRRFPSGAGRPAVHGLFKNSSRRRKAADFGEKNTSAS